MLSTAGCFTHSYLCHLAVLKGRIMTTCPCFNGYASLRKDGASLFHQLDHVFILHHVVLANFLWIVFNGRAPYQSAEKRGVKLTVAETDGCKKEVAAGA